jgi:hypothetical protein
LSAASRPSGKTVVSSSPVRRAPRADRAQCGSTSASRERLDPVLVEGMDVDQVRAGVNRGARRRGEVLGRSRDRRVLVVGARAVQRRLQMGDSH